nr:MAG TPA: hypothetical protein [Caudoviricetes sp.]
MNNIYRIYVIFLSIRKSMNRDSFIKSDKRTSKSR